MRRPGNTSLLSQVKIDNWSCEMWGSQSWLRTRFQRASRLKAGWQA
jgi:hypothetical protein